MADESAMKLVNLSSKGVGETFGLTQGCSMTDHGLEIGAVIDLDISSSGSAGVRESDGSARGDAGKETAFVPRRLPLGIASLVNMVRGR